MPKAPDFIPLEDTLTYQDRTEPDPPGFVPLEETLSFLGLPEPPNTGNGKAANNDIISAKGPFIPPVLPNERADDPAPRPGPPIESEFIAQHARYVGGPIHEYDTTGFKKRFKEVFSREPTRGEVFASQRISQILSIADRIANSEDPKGAARRATELVRLPQDRQALVAAVQEAAQRRQKNKERSVGGTVFEGLRRGKEGFTDAVTFLTGTTGLSLEDQRFASELFSAKEQGDPLGNGHDFLVGWTAQAAEMAVPMLMGAAGKPITAVSFWTAYVYPDEYRDLKKRGMSDKGAAITALGSSFVQAAVEVGFNFDPITRPVKTFARQTMRSFLKEAGANYAKELAEEPVQQFISDLAAYVGTRLDKESKPSVEGAGDMFQNAVNAILQSAGPLLVMMLPGGAIGANRVRRNNKPGQVTLGELLEKIDAIGKGQEEQAAPEGVIDNRGVPMTTDASGRPVADFSKGTTRFVGPKLAEPESVSAKSALLTPEGARGLVENNREAAERIASRPSPSRKDFQGVVPASEKLSQKERTKISRALKQVLQETTNAAQAETSQAKTQAQAAEVPQVAKRAKGEKVARGAQAARRQLAEEHSAMVDRGDLMDVGAINEQLNDESTNIETLIPAGVTFTAAQKGEANALRSMLGGGPRANTLVKVLKKGDPVFAGTTGDEILHELEAKVGPEHAMQVLADGILAQSRKKGAEGKSKAIQDAVRRNPDLLRRMSPESVLALRVLDALESGDEGTKKAAKIVDLKKSGVVQQEQFRVGDKITLAGEEFRVEKSDASGTLLADGTDIFLEPGETIAIDGGTATLKQIQGRKAEKDKEVPSASTPFDESDMPMKEIAERLRVVSGELDMRSPVLVEVQQLANAIGDRAKGKRVDLAALSKRLRDVATDLPSTSPVLVEITILTNAIDRKVSKPSAAQQAAEEADAVNAAEIARSERQQMMSGFPLPRDPLALPERQRGTAISDMIAAPDPEMERRYGAAHGAKEEPKIERIKKVAVKAWHMATRSQVEIPATAEFGSANELFRLAKEINGSSLDEAIRTVASLINPLGEDEMKLYERWIIVQNRVASRSADQREPFRLGEELIGDEGLIEYAKRLDAITEKFPAVKRAIQTRQKVVSELVERLIADKLLPPEARGRAETYFHQQVLMHDRLEKWATTKRGGGKPSFAKRRVKVRSEGEFVDPAVMTPEQRAELAQRLGFKRGEIPEENEIDVLTEAQNKAESLGEEYDPNTSYVESEVKWMTEAIARLGDMALKKKLGELFDEYGNYVATARAKNFEELVGGPEAVRRIEQLRAQIKMLSAVKVRDEPAAKGKTKKLKALRAELQTIDPTQPFRKMMAIGLSNAGMGEKSEEESFYDEANDDDNGIDFNRLRDLARQQTSEDPDDPNNTAIIGAKTFFKYRKQRADFIKKELGARYLTWESLVPDTHALYYDVPGKVFYKAFTIPEQIVEEAQRRELATITLNTEQARLATIMGGNTRPMVMPKEIVAQLESMRVRKVSGTIGKAVSSVQSMWKAWTLLNPLRIIAYNLRNLTGDIDPVLGGAGGALLRRYTTKQFGVLADYYSGRHLALTPEMRMSRDLGVISASFVPQEIPDLKDVALFKHLYSKKEGLIHLPQRMVSAYYEKAKVYTNYREAVLRHAAFLYYRDTLKAGTLRHYGGAKKGVVDRIRKDLGDDVAAAHLSRRLLGDYGDLTVMGDWMKAKLIPFYSWLEINAVRYPRMFLNAIEYGKLKGKGNKWTATVYAAAATAGLMAPYATLWAWNNLVTPQKERDNSVFDRAIPHINVCRYPDGTTMVFRNVGALGDFIEWFGLNTFLNLLPMYLDDKITGKALAAEMAKDPINKLAQGVNPFYKAIPEIATGTSYFPDVANPRSQTRDDTLVGIFGLRDLYHGAKGAILGEGDRARPHVLTRLLFATANPKRNALNETHDLRGRFLEKIGKARPPHPSLSPYRNWQEAAMNENFEQAYEAYDVLRKSGKSWTSGFKQHADSLDPVSNKPNEKLERQFDQWLNATQRQRVRLGRAYAQEVYLTEYAYYERALEEDRRRGIRR